MTSTIKEASGNGGSLLSEDEEDLMNKFNNSKKKEGFTTLQYVLVTPTHIFSHPHFHLLTLFP